jgi:hypothetical protein
LAASPERAKYHCGTHADDCPKPGRRIYDAPSGLANPRGLNFLTQADGLGFVGSPLWG